MNGRARILAVDDDPDILKLVRRTLELEGYDVSTAANGSLALASMQRQTPDLVLLDVMMPGPDGLEVLKIIRQRGDIPVIMLTARHELTTLNQALACGADDYVKKPFSTRVLVARVRARLRRSERVLNTGP